MSVVTDTAPIIPNDRQCGEQKKGSEPGSSRNCRVNWGGVSELSDTFQRPSATQPEPLVVVWLPPVQTQRTQSACSTASCAGWNMNVAPSTVVIATRGTATSTPGSTAGAGAAENASRTNTSGGIPPWEPLGFMRRLSCEPLR